MLENNLFGIKRKRVKRYKKIKRNLIPNFKFSDLDITPVDSDIAIQYISTHHYSKSCTRGIGIAFGIYYDTNLLGCIVYASPVGMNVCKSIADDVEFGQVLELTRLFTDDCLPNNVESYCIGKTIKYIKQNMRNIKYLISYADSTFGHIGMIYQATNWLYTGDIGERIIFEYKGQDIHAKTLSDRYGTSKVDELKKILGPELKVKSSKTKHRYIYVLGQSKVEHKQLLNKVKLEILPYPKQDIKYYRLE